MNHVKYRDCTSNVEVWPSDVNKMNEETFSICLCSGIPRSASLPTIFDLTITSIPYWQVLADFESWKKSDVDSISIEIISRLRMTPRLSISYFLEVGESYFLPHSP